MIPFNHTTFKNIGLIGRINSPAIADTVVRVADFLKHKRVNVILDAETTDFMATTAFKKQTRDEIGQTCDLAIVIGGDGSVLNAARTLAQYPISVVGIHRGRLGFLTDISPVEIEDELTKILMGHYTQQLLCLLHADIFRNKQILLRLDAVNDVVLNAGSITRMIEFELYINDQFVYRQRSDGLIIATPTGSTAYALSGGGPILHPDLGALTLVPMFPHNLTSRPVVISDTALIKFVPIATASTNQTAGLGLSCDGQPIENLSPSDEVFIYKSKKKLHLLHPAGYNYYQTLRTKLQWSTDLI
jgi:NAD+ kinase